MNIPRKRPPYGAQYEREKPGCGPWIAIGPEAWKYAKARPWPIMVLPESENPGQYRWPVHGVATLVIETGPENYPVLHRLAEVLYRDGASNVVTYRLSLHEAGGDGRLFFDLPRQQAA